jgi:hypothetical protein
MLFAAYSGKHWRTSMQLQLWNSVLLLSVAVASETALGQESETHLNSSPATESAVPESTATSSDNACATRELDALAKTITIAQTSADAAVKSAEAASISAKAAANSSDDGNAADTKAGRLMRSGFTVGLAASSHVVFSTKDSRAIGIAASAMPYFAVFPAYWSRGDITRAYCASYFLADDDPKAAADAYAIKRAISRVPEVDRVKIVAACTPDENKKEFSSLDLGQQQDGASCPSPDAITIDKNSSCKDWVCKYTGWKLGFAGRCSWTWLGGYVGLPFAFSANSDVGGSNITRDYKPVGSFGLVFAPSSYAVVLVGISFANVLQHPMDDKMSRSVIVPTFTAGIGGNLDIAAAFFPK